MKFKDGTYHKEVYMPFDIKLPTVLRPIYTQHARGAAENDRYGRIALPNAIIGAGLRIIEVEIRNQKTHKILARISYDSKHDLCVVILGDFRVKTVWLKLKSDRHQTLAREKYVQKEEAA